MNKIVKGITLTSIILGAGLVGVSCKKAPEPSAETTPNHQETPKPKRENIDTRFFRVSSISRNGLEVIAVPVKQGEHFWSLVRQYVTYINNNKTPTEEQLRPYARVIMEYNQHLSRGFEEYMGPDSNGDLFFKLDYIQVDDTLYLPLNEIDKIPKYNTTGGGGAETGASTNDYGLITSELKGNYGVESLL